MVCAEHDALRQDWIATRADYELALADLQVTVGANQFREALRRANAAFCEYNTAESALNDHLYSHRCSNVPVFPPVTYPLRAAS